MRARFLYLAWALVLLLGCGDDADSALPSHCPADPPVAGAECGRAGLTCGYDLEACGEGSTLHRRQVFTCNGTWVERIVECEGPVEDAGLDGGADAGELDGGDVDGGELDAGTFDCTPTSTSTLTGVRLELRDQPCVFTVAEAAAAMSIAYDLVVDAALMNVRPEPQDGGGCQEPSATTGLIVHEVLASADGSHRYCICDEGLCMPRMYNESVPMGTYPMTFTGVARDFSGPSDTGMTPGDPFPPGDYTLRVSAVGTHMGAPFTVEATFPVHLVP